MTTIVTSKNQTAIPQEIAKKYHIRPGCRLEWLEGQDRSQLVVRIVSDRAALARELCGAGASLTDPKDVCRELSQERESEDTERVRGL